jgi:class 3 adenylate cyclase
MEHGSLYDLLHNETLAVDEKMLQRMLQDASQGIRFLHSAAPPVFHGKLTTQNILVDRQFRAKVSDFGLSRDSCTFAMENQFWKAPELLRCETECNAQTDIYAFGMVLYEVYTRTEPYDGEDPREVLRFVADSEVQKRPTLPSTCSAPVQSLIIDCLQEAPELRPSSEELYTRLQRLETDSAETDTSPDTGVVSLFDIFPAHIAEALSKGRKVEPEYRDVVTIFFSDIVNFTTISSSLEPRKVANMLDRLYSAFDNLSTKHDVFKVETIGDAYMAVTNLVSPQQNDHAKRIASFAIDAIEAANTILIDEDDPSSGYISIRVGFHSGPVVADVVGSRNPRYCLFGDTVNTASRMESNSDINRILCSEFSATVLAAQCPEIPVTSRGLITIKGKGDMSTFWVNEAPRERKSFGLKTISVRDFKDWQTILSSSDGDLQAEVSRNQDASSNLQKSKDFSLNLSFIWNASIDGGIEEVNESENNASCSNSKSIISI